MLDTFGAVEKQHLGFFLITECSGDCVLSVFSLLCHGVHVLGSDRFKITYGLRDVTVV